VERSCGRRNAAKTIVHVRNGSHPPLPHRTAGHPEVGRLHEVPARRWQVVLRLPRHNNPLVVQAVACVANMGEGVRHG
jgi:hypothetical protein